MCLQVYVCCHLHYSSYLTVVGLCPTSKCSTTDTTIGAASHLCKDYDVYEDNENTSSSDSSDNEDSVHDLEVFNKSE